MILYVEIDMWLQNGGEFYFSDMYTDKPVTWPAHLKDDKILWGL